jgi:hypothetical protein
MRLGGRAGGALQAQVLSLERGELGRHGVALAEQDGPRRGRSALVLVGVWLVAGGACARSGQSIGRAGPGAWARSKLELGAAVVGGRGGRWRLRSESGREWEQQSRRACALRADARLAGAEARPEASRVEGVLSGSGGR